MTTPSLPTFSIVSAISRPNSFDSAEIDATFRISSFPFTSFAIFRSASTASRAAASMPRRTTVAFAPIAVRLKPSLMMALVRTIAVVVPSPALSFVLFATSLMISAPMFSNLSASEISFAIETPSLVIVGPPYPRSSATFRPRGPRVTRTASATVSAPFLRTIRTSWLKITFFAVIR